MSEAKAVPRRDLGRIRLLQYLIGVAQKTDGAEVWRALFSELLRNEAPHGPKESIDVTDHSSYRPNEPVLKRVACASCEMGNHENCMRTFHFTRCACVQCYPGSQE